MKLSKVVRGLLIILGSITGEIFKIAATVIVVIVTARLMGVEI